MGARVIGLAAAATLASTAALAAPFEGGMLSGEYRNFPSQWHTVPFSVPVTGSGQSDADSISVTATLVASSEAGFVTHNTGSYAWVQVNVLDGSVKISGKKGSIHATNHLVGSVLARTAYCSQGGLSPAGCSIGSLTLAKVPTSPGKSGTFMGTLKIFGKKHNLTVTFFPWITDTAVFTGLTFRKVAVPNLTAMGSWGLDAYGSGTVGLVAPAKIQITGSVVQQKTVSFTKLTLSFRNPACSDRVDNDSDSLVDLLDPGCSDPSDRSEHDRNLHCDDGEDNDQDGLLDLSDPGCTEPPRVCRRLHSLRGWSDGTQEQVLG